LAAEAMRAAPPLARGIKFGNPGRGRATGQAGGKSAQAACCKQPRRILGCGKYARAGNTDGNGRQARGAPPNLIGEAAEEQQRRKIAEDIGRVDQRQRDSREAKGFPVKRIERCRQNRTDKHDAELAGDSHKRDVIVAGGGGIAHCRT